jgi:N-methylhydantoinase A
VVQAESLAKGSADASAASLGKTTIYADGKDWQAGIYDRAKLQSGNKLAGPAVVMQMDTTTLILPGHSGEVDAVGNILIRPNA